MKKNENWIDKGITYYKIFLANEIETGSGELQKSS